MTRSSFFDGIFYAFSFLGFKFDLRLGVYSNNEEMRS